VTQLTLKVLFAVGRCRNSWHALTMIVREGGFRGLWKGWVPNVQRAALVNLGGVCSNILLSRNSVSITLIHYLSVDLWKSSK